MSQYFRAFDIRLSTVQYSVIPVDNKVINRMNFK